jgi:hypothetical protein
MVYYLRSHSKNRKKISDNYREIACDPVTGRLAFGRIPNLIIDFAKKDVMVEDSRRGGWKRDNTFLDKKMRKKVFGKTILEAIDNV